jgi:hypothetical protein
VKNGGHHKERRMIRWLLAFVLVLGTANAQQQPRRQSPVETPAHTSRPGSGWQVPVTQFPEAFNTTAQRINLQLRAIETDCEDRGREVRTCAWRIGPNLPALAGTREDRVTPADFTVFMDPRLRMDGVIDLMGAMTVLSHYLEPQLSLQERGVAVVALFDDAARTTTGRVRLGQTVFSLLVIPNVRTMLSARPVDAPAPR